jgi:transcriptional regulator with XRE-family HTH domain
VANRKKQDPTKSAAALFGYKLRKLRDGRGLSQVQLAEELHCSPDLISKIETTALIAKMEMAVAIDEFFGTGETFQELQPLAAKEGLPGWFQPYAEFEQQASSIRIYDPLLITGLLQIEPYARHVLRATQRNGALDQAVSSRMDRQAILCRADPPWLVFLIRESALREVVGSPEIMKEQLQHLLDVIQEPNINVHVVPTGAPVYPSGIFTIFGFDDGPDVGFVEGANGHGHAIELSSDVEGLKVWYDLVSFAALSPEASERLIRDIMEGL